jgi:O-antigen ligase
VLFVGLVEAFNIERYQVFSKGLSVVKNDPNRGMWGWYQRQRVVERSTRLMEKYPVTGVAAASSALNRQRVIVKNAYTIEGLLLNTYAYAFVSYGLNGLLFIGGVLGTCFYQVKYLRTNRAFAMPAIFAGIGLLVSGFSETTMFTYQVMIPVNIVIALALSNLQRQANQKPHVMSWLTDRFVRAS